MSGPTKGMVAGQPIKTGAQTEAYDEGHSRVFGEAGKERGRWVYTEKGPVKVSTDWEDPTQRQGPPLTSEAEIHGNSVTSAGEDISSRRRRREYMKRTGLTDASDYSAPTMEKIQRQREEVITGEAASRERKEIMGRALYEAKQKKPRR